MEGNFIGTDVTGTDGLGNGGHGVYVQVSNNTIGGTAAGAGNTIAYNGLAGVAVVDGLQRADDRGGDPLELDLLPTRGWGSTWATTA